MNALIGILAGLMLTASVPGFAVAADKPNDEGKMRDRLETITMWRMMERLDMDKPTSEKIVDIRKKYSGQRKNLRKSLNEDLDKLRQIVDNAKQADDKELTALLSGIRDKRKQLMTIREEMYNEVSKVLTVRQQAQLVLFFKDFQHEIRSMMHPPRGKGHPGGPMGEGNHRFGPPMSNRMGPPPPPPGPEGGAPGQQPQGMPGPPTAHWDEGFGPDDMGE